MKSMSARERTLLIAVVSVVLILATLFVLSLVSRKRAALQETIAAREAELASMKSLAEQRGLWAERDAWISANQPRLENPASAGVALLEEMKTLAGSHGTIIENPAIGVLDRKKLYQAAPVNFETKSTWAALVKFLAALQTPGSFLVVEEMRIQIDPSDPTQMRAKFRVARWFAPAGA